MRNNILMSLILLAFTTPVIAGQGWSQTGKIVEVYNLGWTVMIKIEGTPVDYSLQDGCTATSYYALNASDANYNHMLSQILMAHASGVNTRMWIDGESCREQNGGYQMIRSIKATN